VHNLWKMNKVRMDFIQSRTELRSCGFWEFVDWAAMWAHVCGGVGKGCGVLSAGNWACWFRYGGGEGLKLCI